MVERWRRAHDFFLKWTHLDRVSDSLRSVPSDEEFRQHLRVLEDVIEVRTAAFFDAVDSVAELLRLANATVLEGQAVGYEAPSKRLVNEALRRTPTYMLRRAFYERLTNPLWARPLREAGAFAAPPEPEITAEGYVQDVHWPEIDYLTRVASEVPGDVVDVFVAISNSNNASVKRAVIEIGAAITADEGARLLQLPKKWIRAGVGLGWRTDPVELVSFAVALLEGGQTKSGRWLANHLFMPRPGDGGAHGGLGPALVLDEHWYVHGLPRVIPALGADALSATSDWLRAFVEGDVTSLPRHDYSGRLRTSIAAAGGRQSTNALDALVDAVRDLSIARLQELQCQPVLRTLLSSGLQLHRKIAMYVVAEVMRRLMQDELDASHLQPFAEQLLEDIRANDPYLLVEYAELAQVAAEADCRTQHIVGSFLDRAYADDLRRMREHISSGVFKSDAEVLQLAERSKHELLAAIGADALPSSKAAELVELDAQRGSISEPLTPREFLISSWRSPLPALNQTDMDTMSPEELVTALASLRVEGDGWGPEPSHEGQCLAVTELVAANPFAVGVPNLVERLRPTYMAAILNGWQAALRADLDLDWPLTEQVLCGVFAGGAQGGSTAEVTQEERETRRAQEAALGLLGEIVKRRPGDGLPRRWQHRFAGLLIEDAKDELAWVEYDSSDDSIGIVTVSLNVPWTVRLRALMHLVIRLDDGTWRDRALEAVEVELSRSDGHGAGRVVLGENLGGLLRVAPDWVAERVSDLCGSDTGMSRMQQIATTTALQMNEYSRDLFDLLAGPMIGAIRLGEDLESAWRSDVHPISQLGQWVVQALIRGHATTEHPVVFEFFTQAAPERRGQALAGIAWRFFRADSADKSISDRFMALVDSRLEQVEDCPEDRDELQGFFWLAKGAKFPVQWWLPTLKRALELEPRIANERYMIGEELARASVLDPQLAFEVLKMLDGHFEGSEPVAYAFPRHVVPIVIGNAMAAGSPALKRDAEALMHELGAQGALALADEVAAVLGGEVSAADLAH